MRRKALGALLLVAGLGLAARAGAAPPPAPTPKPVPGAAAADELAAGRFLIATRKLLGPFFSQSVVLLLEYSETGAVGLIVNRPTHVSLPEALPELEALAGRSDRVYLGGPVETRLMLFLIRSSERPPDSQRVLDDVHASGSRAALLDAVARNAPAAHLRAFVGYAGWGPGQLDGELARGDWYVAPGEPGLIFREDQAGLWEELVRRYEGLQVRARPPAATSRSARGNALQMKLASHQLPPTRPGRMSELAPAYPPPHHMLRDLAIWIERSGDSSRAGLEVTPELCSGPHGVRAGVLATLVDVIGGARAARAVAPDWIATCDLVLHLLAPVREGVVHASPTLLRRGRSTAVVEVPLTRAGDGCTVGLATLTFSVLRARSEIQRMGEVDETPRTDFALPGQAGLAGPLPVQLGARVIDAAAGVVELPLDAYVANSLGAMQGGAIALLVELSAEAAGRVVGRPDWVASDLAVHYLALGRQGPLVSRARVLRRDAGSALLRVELRDRGAEDRLVAVATCTSEALG